MSVSKMDSFTAKVKNVDGSVFKDVEITPKEVVSAVEPKDDPLHVISHSAKGEQFSYQTKMSSPISVVHIFGYEGYSPFINNDTAASLYSSSFSTTTPKKWIIPDVSTGIKIFVVSQQNNCITDIINVIQKWKPDYIVSLLGSSSKTPLRTLLPVGTNIETFFQDKGITGKYEEFYDIKSAVSFFTEASEISKEPPKLNLEIKGICYASSDDNDLVGRLSTDSLKFTTQIKSGCTTTLRVLLIGDKITINGVEYTIQEPDVVSDEVKITKLYVEMVYAMSNDNPLKEEICKISNLDMMKCQVPATSDAISGNHKHVQLLRAPSAGYAHSTQPFH